MGSGKDWDGYVNFECLNIMDCKSMDVSLTDPTTNQASTLQCITFEQCTSSISNFAANAKANASNKVNELNILKNEANLKQQNFEADVQLKINALQSKRDQILSSEGYFVTKYVTPSYSDYAKSNGKKHADNLASDLAFAKMFCGQDNDFPYNCNARDSNLAKNTSKSFNPYVGAFNKYKKANTKPIKVHDPDAQAKDWNTLTNLLFQLNSSGINNKYTNKDYARMLQKANQILGNLNQGQIDQKQASTKYAECKNDALCSRGIPSDIAEQAFDAVIKEDLDKCGGQRDAGTWYWRAGHCILIAYDVVDLALAGPGPETAIKLGFIQGFKKLGSKLDEIVDGGSSALKAGGNALEECLVGKVDGDGDVDKKDAFALLFRGVEVEAIEVPCDPLLGAKFFEEVSSTTKVPGVGYAGARSSNLLYKAKLQAFKNGEDIVVNSIEEANLIFNDAQKALGSNQVYLKHGDTADNVVELKHDVGGVHKDGDVSATYNHINTSQGTIGIANP